MRVLALDTSHEIGSVSLACGAQGVATAEFGRQTSHLVEMDGAIAEVCERQGCSLADVDRVGLVTGPGSFTGLRIAMAWVKGFYAARRIEIVPLTGLELLALAGASGHTRIAPMIDARRGEVYAALYERGAGGSPFVECLVAPRAVKPEALGPDFCAESTLCLGSGAEAYRSELEDLLGGAAVFDAQMPLRPPTELLCRVAGGRAALTEGEVLELEPYYIRPSDARLRPLKRIGK